MAGFSNQSIKPKVPGKPHIVFVDGYWRVSPFQWGFGGRRRWNAAHSWVERANQGLHFRRWLDGLEKTVYSEKGLQQLSWALKSALK